MRRTLIVTFAAVALILGACGQVTPVEDAGVAESPAPSDEAPGADATAIEEVPICAEVGRRVSPADCEVYESLAQSAERGAAAFNAPDPMRRGETHMLQLAVSFAPPEPPAPAPTPGATTTEPSPTDTSTGVTREEVAELEAQLREAQRTSSTAEAERLARELEVARAREITNPPPAPPPAPPATPGDTVEDLPGQTVEFEPLVGRFMRAELTGVGFQITPRSPASQEVTPDSVTTWNWEVVAQQGGARSLTLTTVVEGCTGDGSECVPLRSTTQNYTVNVEVGPIDQVRDFIAGIPGWLQAIAAVLTALAGLIAAWFGVRSAIKRGRSES
jgi:hypothetical protein